METPYHKPVLLNECIEGLQIKPTGIYVDATFGGGGHSREIMSKLTSGRVFAFDQDSDATVNAQSIKENPILKEKFVFVKHNFKYIKLFLRYYNVKNVHGILADLGVSWHQFDEPERGFSFRTDANLDMRMNQDSGLTAATILNTYADKQLLHIFSNYGEVQNTRQLVAEIIKCRAVAPINRIDELKTAIARCVPRNNENQYLAKVFQALRIEANGELEALKRFLLSTVNTIKPGGRLVIITYHSLEDRLVKNFIKAGNFEGDEIKDLYGNSQSPFKAINNRVITPTEEELERNSRARSAKLRIAERVK